MKLCSPLSLARSRILSLVWLPVWLSGNALVSISYSTPGPVSAWMGDRLWTGKPLHLGAEPGLSIVSLSLPSVGRRDEYPAKAGEVNRHIV